jgi:hypothetical protein
MEVIELLLHQKLKMNPNTLKVKLMQSLNMLLSQATNRHRQQSVRIW